MKKFFFALAIVLLWGIPIFSDVIPENSHIVSRDVRITNLSQFPELVIVGYITGPMVEHYEVYLVKENTPLYKGYKFNQLRLFVIKKSVFDHEGGLNGIDFEKLAQKVAPVEIVDPNPGKTVIDDNPLVAEEYYYRIEAVTATTLTLKLDRWVLKYNDGTADKVEQF